VFPVRYGQTYRSYWVRYLVDLESAGETVVLGANLPQCHFSPPQMSHDLTWDRTRVAEVGNWRLRYSTTYRYRSPTCYILTFREEFSQICKTPTSDGRSVGIVRLRTQTTEFVLFMFVCLVMNKPM
jgi:hypothetical protein